jgi:drug/metabolite transporter (DMT)-like permease
MAGAYALIAFFGLTAIHVSAAILYKYSQSGGKYEYSPATTLVLAEVFKIFLSLFLHCMSTWEVDSRLSLSSRLYSGVKYALKDAWRQVNVRILGQLASLALSYAVYNQCQFLVFMWADAASVILLRSSGSFVAAVMAYFLLQRVIVRLQWLNILLQVFGLILVQYDSCKAQTVLSPVLYFVLFLHVSLSSFNSIWNEHLVKSKDAPSLNVQNACLYFFGAIFNFGAYLLLPASLYGSTSLSTGFFHGYSVTTILIVALNSVIGLAITAVYKYADVIVKTFSLACATGTLFLFDFLFFGRPITLNVLLGIVVVYGASYLYFVSAPKSSLPAPSTVSASAAPSATVAAAIPPARSRSSLLCLLVPEFLVIKAPPKTTLVSFFVALLLIGSYVATHTSELKPMRIASKSEDSTNAGPIGLLVPFHFAKAGVYNASAPEKVIWTPGIEVQPRFLETNNNLDRLALMWRSQRAAVQGSNYDLAVCFYGATSASVRTALRWNAELDVATFSSFDKFVMQSSSDVVGYGAVFDPVAFINAPYTPNMWLGQVTAKLSQECSLDDWAHVAHSISVCAEMLEYHSQKHGITYRWAWITDPNVDWNDGAAPIDRSTAQPSLPDFKTMEPPANAIFMRDHPILKSTTKTNDENGFSSSIPDPTSILGSYKNVIEFSRSLKLRTDVLAKANSPSSVNTIPDSPSDSHKHQEQQIQQQEQQQQRRQVQPIDLSAVIKAVTESLYISISHPEFLPPGNASFSCMLKE